MGHDQSFTVQRRPNAQDNTVTLEGGLEGGRDFVRWILTVVHFAK